MKRISSALFILGGLLLAGCVKNEITGVNSQSSDYISFSGSTSRASVSDLSTLQSDVNGFTVYGTSGTNPAGWYNDSAYGGTGAAIDGTNPHIYGAYVSGLWDFQDRVKWPTAPAGYPMNFYAFYPKSPAGLVMNAPSFSPTVLTGAYTVQSRGAQVDLLTGNSTANNKPASSSLTMPFTHALSKINVGIFGGAGTTIQVASVQFMNIPDTRTYDFVGGAWASPQAVSGNASYSYFSTYAIGADPANATGPRIIATGAAEDGTSATASAVFGDNTILASGVTAANSFLMLMPQASQSWDPANPPVPAPPAAPTVASGAYVAVLYQMSTGSTGGTIVPPPATGVGNLNEVGFANASDHPDYATSGSTATGPLFVLAGFPLAASGGNFEWDKGFGYTYNIGLGIAGGCNGYILDDVYYTQDGVRHPELPLVEVEKENKQLGDKLQDGIIHVVVSVDPWDDQPGGDHNASSIFITPSYMVVPYAGSTPGTEFQTLQVTYRDSNGNPDPNGTWTLTSSDPSWLLLSLNADGSGAGTTINGVGNMTVYLVTTYNPTAPTAGNNGYRTAYLYQGGVTIVAATIVQTSDPALIPAAGNVITPVSYAGAFWRADQTGERVVDIPVSGVMTTGHWSATVAWYDARWNLDGGDGIVLSPDPSPDPNLGTNTPGNAEMYQITGTTAQFVEGTVPPTGGNIFFRIGLQKKFSTNAACDINNPNYSATFPARYGVILISYNDGAVVQKFFLRQGEGADYIMRPSDPASVTNGAWALPGAARVAARFSPYNITDPNKNTPPASATYGAAHTVGTNGGVFVQYPSMAGSFFSYSNSTSAPNTATTAAVLSPSFTAISGSPGASSGTNFWATNMETCPPGYRRPSDQNPANDGSANGATGTAKAASGTSTPNNSELRQSMFLVPAAGNGSGARDLTNSIQGGYYADGYFDRMMLGKGPATDDNGTLSTVGYPPGQTPASGSTSTNYPDIAYMGYLFFNPTTNASCFIPNAGYRSTTAGTLVSAGWSGHHHWTSTTSASGASSWNFAAAQIGSVDRSFTMPIRCVSTNNPMY